ncbi:SidE phosphodiesterase domain-containing protein [Legionella drancourtii]|uniref:SidE PDE domain-containing protein n=1 Tax=Legionella drancourtii LLAP12 TaxID=658187 RepID=G9EIJ6_9GAMM|nr:SidE phosphodiesterase domain-containing protein [Legionella drancourtii]EHL32764.1 hypothetical protein LDG_5001 [Legionella drancourtii LLAP12]
MSNKHDAIKHAAQYVYDNFLSKPYTGNANRNNQVYRCSNDQIIHRPNHGLPHSLRKMSYSNAVISFLRHHDKTNSISTFCFTDEEQLAIKLCLLFSVTGREDEAGHKDSPEAYRKYLAASANHFEEFCKNNTTFNSETIDRFKKIIIAKHDQNNRDPARAVVHFCHELDLLRCFPPKAMISHLRAFNSNFNSINNRDFTQLILYAQKCITQTGDCLSTKFKEHHGRVLTLDGNFPNKISFSMPYFSYQKRDDIRFAACSHSVDKCLEAIAGVASPVSYISEIPYITKSEEEKEEKRMDDFDIRSETQAVLELIKSTEACIRLINFKPGDEQDFAFEMKQICDPVFFRSTKPAHSEQKIGDRRHYIDQQKRHYVYRLFKDYEPIENQPLVDNNPPHSNYFDEHEQPLVGAIHKEEDRGKPKNTVFAKKKAYSLLRPDGKQLHFQGTTFKRAQFNPVGIINDVRQMHLHGERYIWLKDVCSDDKFWTGELARQHHEDELDIYSRKVAKVIDVSERQQGVSLQKLQDNLNQKALEHAPADRRNEMLVGPSKASMRGLFAPEDTLYSRLNMLYANVLLREDYGKPVAMLIIDGKQAPKAYTPRMIQKDLAALVSHYATFSPWVALKQFLGFSDQGKDLFDALSQTTSVHAKHDPNEFISSILAKAGIANDLLLKDRSAIRLASTREWFVVELVKTLAVTGAAFVCLLPLITYTFLAAVTACLIAPFTGFRNAWQLATKPLSKLCAYFIYPSRHKARLADDPELSSMSQMDLKLQTRWGDKLEAIQFNPNNFAQKNPSEQKYILCINGRDSLFADDDKLFQMQEDSKATDAAVMSFNMPGIGNSKGSSTYAADLVTVTTDIVKNLIHRGVKPENILLKGHSLGGAIATLTVANLHQENHPVRLFVDRSFSSLSNVMSDKFTTIWGGKLLFKPVINYLLSLAGWNIDSADAWHTIPDEYKTYVTIQGRAGHQQEEKRYDGVITDSGALHNDPKIKKDRKHTKDMLDQLRYCRHYKELAEAKLNMMKNSKLVKLEDVAQTSLPTGSHNLSLAHLRLRGARETSAAHFFQSYARETPENIKNIQHQFDEACFNI